MTEVENDAPGNKKVEADRWSVIEGRLSIFSDTELKKKSKLVVPAVYEGEKVRSLDVTCSEGTFSNYLTYVEIEEGIETIEYGFVSCPNLKTVIIPDSVKKLDEYEFRDCKDKVTLYVKNTLTQKNGQKSIKLSMRTENQRREHKWFLRM